MKLTDAVYTRLRISSYDPFGLNSFGGTEMNQPVQVSKPKPSRSTRAGVESRPCTAPKMRIHARGIHPTSSRQQHDPPSNHSMLRVLLLRCTPAAFAESVAKTLNATVTGCARTGTWFNDPTLWQQKRVHTPISRVNWAQAWCRFSIGTSGFSIKFMGFGCYPISNG